MKQSKIDAALLYPRHLIWVGQYGETGRDCIFLEGVAEALMLGTRLSGARSMLVGKVDEPHGWKCAVCSVCQPGGTAIVACMDSPRTTVFLNLNAAPTILAIKRS